MIHPPIIYKHIKISGFATEAQNETVWVSQTCCSVLASTSNWWFSHQPGGENPAPPQQARLAWPSVERWGSSLIRTRMKAGGDFWVERSPPVEGEMRGALKEAKDPFRPNLRKVLWSPNPIYLLWAQPETKEPQEGPAFEGKQGFWTPPRLLKATPTICFSVGTGDLGQLRRQAVLGSLSPSWT